MNLQRHIEAVLQLTWIAAAVVWVAGCLTAKRASRSEARRARIFHLALITIAFALLFSSRLRVGVLAIQVVPDADWTRYLGLVLTVAGVLFAIWGRASLGRNWSGVVSIKQEHHLVRHGPYAIVRHPIYSGFLLAMLGTALADGQTGCLIAVALAFLAWWLKSRTEEEFLAAQFGDAYTNYQARVRALVPFVF